jgi:hypothetical protein
LDKKIIWEQAAMSALFFKACGSVRDTISPKKTLAGVRNTCQVCLLTPQKMKSHLIFLPRRPWVLEEQYKNKM